VGAPSPRQTFFTRIHGGFNIPKTTSEKEAKQEVKEPNA